MIFALLIAAVALTTAASLLLLARAKQNRLVRARMRQKLGLAHEDQT